MAFPGPPLAYFNVGGNFIIIPVLEPWISTGILFQVQRKGKLHFEFENISNKKWYYPCDSGSSNIERFDTSYIRCYLCYINDRVIEGAEKSR